ncbi:MAG: biopolymer transporter ExbD [Phycisphaerales bacterium]|nr:biopolymer transporter ExbD [Phycisphaerales bacterium]NNM25328.1 biopolymer transporter ExbD [Phycisphaerales bacterium]
MRIRVRSSRRRTERITLNLASMIDVTFLLLIYFMVTMVMAEQEDRLSPTLQTQSEQSSGAATDFQPQIIRVRMSGDAPAYHLGGRILPDRDGLQAALEPLPKSVGVFVEVHDGVPVGFAVTAIQVARDAGFEQVTYVPAK